ncbi:putative peroxisomal biogenesis factor 11 [Helianthus anomalus]
MSTLDVARTELALRVLYLNKAEARDKICRAIQYGSNFFVNDLHALISPTAPGTPLPLNKERAEIIGRVSLL